MIDISTENEATMAMDEKKTRNEQEAPGVHSDTAAVRASGPVSFEQALRNWEQEIDQIFEANRAAEQLSAEDLAIRINAKA
jgi:hypothetical protein